MPGKALPYLEALSSPSSSYGHKHLQCKTALKLGFLTDFVRQKSSQKSSSPYSYHKMQNLPCNAVFENYGVKDLPYINLGSY